MAFDISSELIYSGNESILPFQSADSVELAPQVQVKMVDGKSIGVITLNDILMPDQNLPILLTEDINNPYDFLQERIDKNYSVGIAAATLSANQQVSFYNVGTLSTSGTQHITEDTLFEIGSITKVFTNILLADLAIKHKINLNDPISKYLPNIKIPTFNDIEITLLHLATHTSALPRTPTNLVISEASNPFGDYTFEQFKTFLNSYTLEYEPGTQSIYSNVGIALLGQIISDIHQKPYEQVLQEIILDPLGMNNTYIHVPSEKLAELAEGHIGTQPSKHWQLYEFYMPTGAIVSSTKDMMKFLQHYAHLTHSPLDDAMALTQQVHFKTPESEEAIGLGVGIYDGYYLHEGGTNGFSSIFIVKPADSFGNDAKISLVLSSSTHGVMDIAAKLLENNFELTPLFEPNKNASKDLWGNFIGSYPNNILSEVDGNAHISIQNNQLYLNIYRADIPLYAISENQFFTHDRFPFIEFETDSNRKMVLKFTNKDGDIFSVKKLYS